MSNILLIILSVTLGSLGQVILKLGANKLGKVSLVKIHTFIFEILKIPEILIGLVLFGTSFLLWIKVLTKSDLSYAYPMVSLGYIIVVIFSFLLFNEPFTIYKVIGITMIILGVITINI